MSLNITFEKTSKTDYIYSDLHLDLVKGKTPQGDGFLYRKSGNADIRTDFDEHAIGNSLRNLFSTRPLQRILDPDYGLDLTRFLFENANEYTARTIARTIIKGIERYEPRVTVSSIDVIADAENNRYTISMFLFIPTIDREIEYVATLNDGVFAL